MSTSRTPCPSASCPTPFRLSLLGLLCLTFAACSSGPRAPDWQLEAKGAVDRSVAAYLEGNSRVEALEFTRARAAISSTGQVDLMAKAELLHCAAQVASLVFEPCAGFEKLRQDAAPAQRAYADYLGASLQPQDAALLPPAQRAAVAGGDVLPGIADPLSQLVAAGVWFRAGRASPALVQQAVDAAASQGWRRPLLAWLGVQARLAEKAGDSQQAARLYRRIELIQNNTGPAR